MLPLGVAGPSAVERKAALSQLSALCTQVRAGSVPLRRRMATAARDTHLSAVHDDERASSTPVIILGAGAAGLALALALTLG